MASDLFDDRHQADQKRDWSVYRCPHGCVHVALDRITLTFTDEEFHVLRDLMSRASLQLPGPQPRATSTNAH